MDPELRQHLEAMEARLSVGFHEQLARLSAGFRDQLAQVSADLHEQLAEVGRLFSGQLAEVSAAVSVQLEQVRAESREDLERVETRLLTEFHKWASPLDARMRTHTATLRALDLEMEALNDRLKKLEPPAA